MSLQNQQSDFAKALALLILFAYQKGYQITFGDVWAKSGHRENSFHYKRLAADLNLFKDGEYLEDTQDHIELGRFWESIGGTWGGRFKHGDGNHYEWTL